MLRVPPSISVASCEHRPPTRTVKPKIREFLDTRRKGLSNRCVTKDSLQSSSVRDGWFENRHSLRIKSLSARINVNLDGGENPELRGIWT